MLSGGPAERREQNQQDGDSGAADVPFSSTTTGQLGMPSGHGALSRQTSMYTHSHPATASRAAQETASSSAHFPNHPQYTIPQQVSHSPVGFPQDPQSRSGNLTGGRPNSRGNLFAPPPPLHHQQSSGVYAHGVSSLSPTPSSHPSQTPHSTRQSPLSVLNQPHTMQQSHQHSQPATPVGPPQIHHQRSAQYEVPSPSLYRSVSATSAGIPPASPVNQHLHSGQVSGSPNAYPSISSHLRHSSDYGSRADRERSESVSPKTKVPPRPPTTGSRHGSLHELPTARSSGSVPGAGMNASPSNAGYSQFATPVTQASGSMRNVLTSEVTQTSPRQLHAGMLPMTQALNMPPESAAPAPALRIPPQPISHHSQKMDMNHLLTPSTDAPPVAANGNNMLATPARHSAQKDSQMSTAKMSPRFQRPTASTTPSDSLVTQNQQGISVASSPMSQSHSLKERSSPMAKRESLPRATHIDSNSYEQRPTLKRAADSELSGPVLKQRRTQRRIARPPWARISKHNPRFQGAQANGTFEEEPQSVKAKAPPVTNGGTRQPINDHVNHVNNVPADRPAWLHNPPLDLDLIKARNILGPWEKTFMWNTPYPDLLRAVQDWTFVTLDGLQDVGWSPNDGAVEIEAKIGTLLDRDDQRCNLPVATSTLISPSTLR